MSWFGRSCRSVPAAPMARGKGEAWFVTSTQVDVIVRELRQW